MSEYQPGLIPLDPLKHHISKIVDFKGLGKAIVNTEGKPLDPVKFINADNEEETAEKPDPERRFLDLRLRK